MRSTKPAKPSSAKRGRMSRHSAPKRVPQGNKAALVRLPAAPMTLSERIEQVVIGGDLSGLTAEERLQYIKARCQDLGINWRAQPFAYISLNGKLVLYALRSCTDQLRRVHGVSVFEQTQGEDSGLWVVQVKVRDRTGRTDTGTGAWPIEGTKGEARVNAILKAETKAKRRATLSICGLGMLDESELDTLDEYGTLTPGGRVMYQVKPPDPEFWCNKHNCDIDRCPSDGHTSAENEEMDKLTKRRKLTAPQKEIVDRKIAEAKSSQPAPIMETEYVDPAKSRCAECGSSFGVHLMKCSQFRKSSQERGPAKESGAAQSPTFMPPAPDSLRYQLTPSGLFEITGPESVLKANREVLKLLWSANAGAIMADAAQLGKLISHFERMKVPFRDVTPREAGE